MLVVNLTGGPGCGKSTVAAGVYNKLKKVGVNVEYVGEYAKDKVWDRHFSVFDDQIYIFAKQYHKIFRLKDQVDVVITDSPILLTLYYNKDKGAIGSALQSLVLATHFSFDNMNFFLDRNVPYTSVGRMQTKMEAIEIDEELKKLYAENNISLMMTEGIVNIENHISRDIITLLQQEHVMIA